MNKSLQVGDLVQILHSPNPLHNRFEGMIRTIRERSPTIPENWRVDPPALLENGFEVSWKPWRLKYIPPLSERESTETKEEKHHVAKI